MKASVRSSIVILAALSTTGCGGMFARYGRSAQSSSSSSGHAGPITIVNQTEHSICTIDVNQNGAEPDFISVDLSGSPLAQGGSTVVETAGTVYKIRLIECGDEYVLWDSNDPRNNRASDTVTPDGRPFVLAEGGSVEGNLLQLERTPISAYASQPGSFQGEFGEAALAAARAAVSAHNYSEQPTGATVTASDWEYNRHRRTGAMIYRWFKADIGARWPDGHCTIQAMGFSQQHDGSDFVDSLEGQGFDPLTQRQVPCAALSTMATQ